MGRPSSFTEEYKTQALELAKLGLTDAQMAKVFGVTEQTFNNWKKANPDFFASLKEHKAFADAKVEQALFKKATGFEQGDKFFPPDTTACIFWLKNRQPDNWKDVKERIDTHRVEEGEINMIELARRLASVFQDGLNQAKTLN